jgi:hypothetical protein
MNKEPLTIPELRIWANLHLHLPKVNVPALSEEQKFSAARVISKQGPVVEAWDNLLEGYLGIRFNHIFIGIEKDGYSHS